MKIILSRKGFDSSCGGVPSPILPDGTLLSLPIPSRDSPITYDDLRLGDQPIGSLVEGLTKGRLRGGHGAHLDPDLRESMVRRLPGWRPLFGQDGTAQGHLANSRVGVGDLFLFFGWFRQAEEGEGGYRLVRGAPDLHVVYGWLQIGEIIPVEEGGSGAPAWARYHSHFHGDSEGSNTVYVARDDLVLPGMEQGCAGAGAFESYREGLRLTAPGRTRTWWRLPRWFFPEDGRAALTYHGNRERWTRHGDHVLLRSAARGQEFVLDTADYPEAVAWAWGLVKRRE